jgi:hypothetical protein
MIGAKKMVSDQRLARLPVDVVEKDLSYDLFSTVN